MRSFFNRKRGAPFLVLDIEDDFVKSLILRKEGERLVVLGSASEDSGNLEEDLSKSINNAYQKFIFSANKQERQKENFPVLLGLPSSVLKARVANYNINRSDNLPISRPEELEINKRVLKEIKKKIGREFALESGILPTDIRYTNFKMLEKTINGYPVPTLSNFNGKNLSFKILGTFLPENDFVRIRAIIEGLGFRISKIAHIAEALSEVSYTRDFKNIKDLSSSLSNSKYVPTLLMSYYAKEIF